MNRYYIFKVKRIICARPAAIKGRATPTERLRYKYHSHANHSVSVFYPDIFCEVWLLSPEFSNYLSSTMQYYQHNYMK